MKYVRTITIEGDESRVLNVMHGSLADGTHEIGKGLRITIETDGGFEGGHRLRFLTPRLPAPPPETKP